MKTMQLAPVAAILLLLGVADIALVSLSLLVKAMESAYLCILGPYGSWTKLKCKYHGRHENTLKMEKWLIPLGGK
jgi:polyferredoxin